MDVAAAAVKQADAKEAGQPRRGDPDGRPAPGRRARRARSRARDRRPGQAGKGAEKPRKPRKLGRAITPTGNVVRVYVGAGRKSKVRPADLVGAIVNEAGIDPRAIGAIQITDRFSLVEVPDEIADDIIGTLRATTIKGKEVPVRRDREQGA